jgi:hypothetical protein
MVKLNTKTRANAAPKSNKQQSIIQLFMVFAIVVLFNLVLNPFFFRIDLRVSLSLIFKIKV